MKIKEMLLGVIAITLIILTILFGVSFTKEYQYLVMSDSSHTFIEVDTHKYYGDEGYWYITSYGCEVYYKLIKKDNNG